MNKHCIPPLFRLLPLSVLVASADARPLWIWAPPKVEPNQSVWVRKTFQLDGPLKGARVSVSADNTWELWINGEFAGRGNEWSAPKRVNAEKFLKPGSNVIAIKAGNDNSSAAGLVARVERGKQVLLESDASWKVTAQDPGGGWEKPETSDASWAAAMEVAKLGDAPWGDVFAGGARGGSGGSLLPSEEVKVLPGFKAELIYSVPKGDQGSWVSMTVDDKGRLITGDQGGGLYRVTLKDGAEPEVEPLGTKAGHAQGLLHINGALYVVTNGPGPGLYRLRDTDGDDKYDEETLLRPIEGGGEHGPHAVIAAPDRKSIYVIGGNHTKTPDPEKSRVPRLWQEDHLVPRMWDANGHAQGILAPGGWICRTDFDGKEWELISMGYRNQYDVAFNATGDLFTYDADMEWDVGTPWYRPTRICQAMPGSEFGWRSGSGKWPVYYPDSLPPVTDIGPGSPTGVEAGLGAKFPAKYQHAIYAADWTFGTMYAIHLTPDGASWKGVKEEFVSGKPLPLTDLVIHPKDGAMYFLVGGRGTQSGLYRVTYTGSESTAPAPAPELTPEMKLRRELESLQLAGPSAAALDKAWAQLGHADRWIRFAARTAVEFQPAATWAQRALDEKNPAAATQALLALSRAAAKEHQAAILAALGRIDSAALAEPAKLDLIRTYAVCLVRGGMPDEAARAAIRARFEPQFPAASEALNKELCDLLCAVGSPGVVSRAIQLLTTARDDANQIAEEQLIARNDGYAKGVRDAMASRPNRQQIAYSYALRIAKEGWTPELRRQYFRWFNGARKFQGGNSLRGFIEMIRKDALANVPAEMKAELEGLSEELNAVPADLPRPQGPGRAWTIDEVMALTANGLKGRSYDNGAKMFKAVLCANCHQFGTEGRGGIGPDVTGAGNRYTMRDLLENIMEPSKVISDQYESTLIEKKDGSSVVGRVLQDADGKVKVAENPLAPDSLTEIAAADIKARSKFPVSAMPPALLNSLNENEVLDLMAYLLSGGNKDDKAFRN
jgi:putative heme-binding domain-containing protein